MANSSGLLIVIGEPLCGPNICSASIVRAVRAAVKRPLWRRLEPRPEGLVLAGWRRMAPSDVGVDPAVDQAAIQYHPEQIAFQQCQARVQRYFVHRVVDAEIEFHVTCGWLTASGRGGRRNPLPSPPLGIRARKWVCRLCWA